MAYVTEQVLFLLTLHGLGFVDAVHLQVLKRPALHHVERPGCFDVLWRLRVQLCYLMDAERSSKVGLLTDVVELRRSPPAFPG